MITEAQRRATARYRKKAYKRISFMLNKETEADLIETFENIPHKAEWFREVLREHASGRKNGRKK